MAFFSLEHTSRQRRSSLVSALVNLRARAVASWRSYKAERALEGLSYDTLKDIGFPSADMANDQTTVR